MAGSNWVMVILCPSIQLFFLRLYNLQPLFSKKCLVFFVYYIGECVYYWDTMGIIEGSGTCILLILCVLDMYPSVLNQLSSFFMVLLTHALPGVPPHNAQATAALLVLSFLALASFSDFPCLANHADITFNCSKSTSPEASFLAVFIPVPGTLFPP